MMKHQIGQVTRNVKEQEATLKLEAKRTQLYIAYFEAAMKDWKLWVIERYPCECLDGP